MRRALRLGSLALIPVLVAYCELCSIVDGLPAPGLGVSGPWAVQVSIGWLLAGAFLGTFGERLAETRMALLWPRAAMLSAVLVIAAFALSCEMLLLSLRGGLPEMPLFIHERAPIALAASAVLVLLYVAIRSRPPSVPAQTEQASELIEVMTGKGRVWIRVTEIESLQADGNYINVVHVSGRTYLLRQTLSALEKSFDPERFVRVHRSTIVNRELIKERRRGGVLVLQSGLTVSIGRAFRDRLS